MGSLDRWPAALSNKAAAKSPAFGIRSGLDPVARQLFITHHDKARGERPGPTLPREIRRPSTKRSLPHRCVIALRDHFRLATRTGPVSQPPHTRVGAQASCPSIDCPGKRPPTQSAPGSHSLVVGGTRASSSNEGRSPGGLAQSMWRISGQSTLHACLGASHRQTGAPCSSLSTSYGMTIDDKKRQSVKKARGSW